MTYEECDGNCEECRHCVPVMTATGEFYTTGLGLEIIYRCDMEWKEDPDD